ncbi:hypothetical protein [Roseibacillus ishigakijimensis]|uniref:Uncharacterized protein n=1 Tax=Roseibacillus ishigakijimensis TaxID=454146 RepID=A0A934RPD8_9BACT|nr:hypothetical protein [Roseibacillus ishigakijimensis]MBK1835064.1 hypothetical protein [Roseibacillus ishigakijimensis]
MSSSSSESQWEWDGHPLTLDDFYAVRVYIDACLNPKTAPGKLPYALTTDLDLLLKLVKAMDRLIPWPAEATGEWKIPQPVAVLPPEPPRPPDFLPAGEPLDLWLEQQEKEIAHWENEIRYHDNNPKKKRQFPTRHLPRKRLKEILTSLQKEKDDALEWKERHSRWIIEHQPDLDRYQRYLQAQAAYEKSAQIQYLIRTEYSQSLFFKKILSRQSKEIRRAKERGGLLYSQVPWELLPSGEGFYRRLHQYFQGEREKLRSRRYLPERLQFMESLSPVKAYLGKDEFNDYVAYFFKGSTYAVLESPWSGNAIYFLPASEWVRLSKYCRTDLLESPQAQVTRLIHGRSGKWKQQVRKRIQPKSPP